MRCKRQSCREEVCSHFPHCKAALCQDHFLGDPAYRMAKFGDLQLCGGLRVPRCHQHGSMRNCPCLDCSRLDCKSIVRRRCNTKTADKLKAKTAASDTPSKLPVINSHTHGVCIDLTREEDGNANMVSAGLNGGYISKTVGDCQASASPVHDLDPLAGRARVPAPSAQQIVSGSGTRVIHYFADS